MLRFRGSSRLTPLTVHYIGWWMGYMVKYTHLRVVGYICKGTDDSYDVQGVLDTQ